MTQLTDNAEQIRDNFGYSATFTPAAGAAVVLDVELLETIEMEPAGVDSMIPVTRTRIQYLAADLAAEINRGETFLIGTTTYTVETIETADNWFTTVGVI